MKTQVKAHYRKGRKVRAHSRNIMKLYTDKGIKPPEGKGIHTKKFHEMATAMMENGVPKDIAYATAMKKLGRNKSVKKPHRQLNK